MVKCGNEGNGCGWIGKLQQLSDHTSKCEYTNVECPNKCGESILHLKLNHHLKDECELRTYKCPNCDEVGQFRIMFHLHPQTCMKDKISCPRECGSTIVRCSLEKHLGVCSNEEVFCKYEGIGCMVNVLRKDLKRHEDDDKLHLQLALDRIAKLQNDVHILQECVQVTPCVIKMTDYCLFKSEEKPWYSPPFYTHPGGYKMCLKVHANGSSSGKGTHVSFFIYFMHGRNDDSLSWPFRGEICVKLLNQVENSSHSQHTLKYKDKNSTDNNRVTEGERAPTGLGKPQFVAQSMLNLNPLFKRQYLKNDCLYFQVSVENPSPAKPWLVCTI